MTHTRLMRLPVNRNAYCSDGYFFAVGRAALLNTKLS